LKKLWFIAMEAIPNYTILNLFVISEEVYWEVLPQRGNSDLKTQKRLLKAVLPLFKNYPVLVLGDREFHSPKLAEWLDSALSC
jgi:hypothetical protein